jgi:regulatory protein YycI of two-component signal transduction system YycFG
MTILLVSLIVIDLVLLGALLFLNQKRNEYIEVIKELNEERQVLRSLKDEVKSDLLLLKSEGRKFYDKVSLLATEAEQEINSGKSALRENLKSSIAELAPSLEKPLADINRQQLSLEKTIRRSDQSRDLLIKSIDRGEKLLQILTSKVPFDKALEEMKDAKYTSARQLLSHGLSPREVSAELNIPESEVRLLAGFKLS